MKILFDHHTPFLLAHGGQQIQIEQTKAALEKLGVEVEYLRWWDACSTRTASQTGDILHFFGRIPIAELQVSRSKGMKVVVSDLFGQQGTRSLARLKLQKLVMKILRETTPGAIESMNWDSYLLADACVALTSREAYLLTYVFGVSKQKQHLIPNGVEDLFLQSKPVSRSSWLVCVSTIAAHKRVLELAQAAVQAQTPLRVIGKPYSDADPYAKRFLQFAKQHPQFLRFEGAIEDRAKMAQAYREARGFVLLSEYESLSLAALEAAACECPLLLSDLPWSNDVFGKNASYCRVTSKMISTAEALRRFYEAAPTLKPPPKPVAWTAVAQQLKALYESILKPADKTQ